MVHGGSARHGQDGDDDLVFHSSVRNTVRLIDGKHIGHNSSAGTVARACINLGLAT